MSISPLLGQLGPTLGSIEIALVFLQCIVGLRDRSRNLRPESRPGAAADGHVSNVSDDEGSLVEGFLAGKAYTVSATA